MTVYWASIEYSYDKPEDKLLGGFVYAFVKALNPESALDSITLKLKNQFLTVINAEFIKDYDPKMQWEKATHTKHYFELYLLALNSSEVVLDSFYAYEMEE